MFSFDAANEPLIFTGRMVQWGDVPFHADELLEKRSGIVEKGRVCGASGSSVDGCVNTVYNAIANDGDHLSNTLSFRRPDTVTGTYLIVPDSAPQTLFDALVTAANRITGLNPTGDCLSSSSLQPIRQASYNALDAFTRSLSYTIAVTYTSNACSGALACLGFPSFKTAFFPDIGTFSSRVAIGGGTLDINSNRLPVDNTCAVGSTTCVRNLGFSQALLHELNHGLGRSHAVNTSAAFRIPGTGTYGGPNPTQSVMCPPPPSSCASSDLSPDDVKSITTLYSDSPSRSNDSCTYSSSFRSFGPIGPSDPGCFTGILSADGNYCCPISCGACGGGGCGSRPGGSLNCCTAGIDFIGATCSGSQAPCATGLLDPP
jgi:hypothetical protein